MVRRHSPYRMEDLNVKICDDVGVLDGELVGVADADDALGRIMPEQETWSL